MKISFHYTYLIMAIGFILAGYITNLLVFTSIILVHELGHFLAARIYNFEIYKIIIYPYGGLTKINNKVNENINKELSVAISGIIMQLFFYLIVYILYKNNFLREYIFHLFSNYNKNILLFNILPIVPLDGSKILNLILYKFIPLKLSNIMMLYISFFTIIILLIINYYELNYTMLMTISILINSIHKYYKSINYYFNRFILERYLYHYKYKDHKIIKDIKHMYKNKSHIFHINKKYIKEDDYIKRFFLKK